jgi:hypothetical protein
MPALAQSVVSLHRTICRQTADERTLAEARVSDVNDPKRSWNNRMAAAGSAFSVPQKSSSRMNA